MYWRLRSFGTQGILGHLILRRISRCWAGQIIHVGICTSFIELNFMYLQHLAAAAAAAAAAAVALLLLILRPRRILLVSGWPFNTGRGGGGMVFLPNQNIFSFHQENKTFFSPWAKTNTFFLRCHRQTFFFQDMFQDPFNCETGMLGTVTCRPTVADRVQVDGINVSN